MNERTRAVIGGYVNSSNGTSLYAGAVYTPWRAGYARLGAPNAVIDRLDHGDQGTFGKIWARGLSLFTGELPWRDNSPNISCVPPMICRVAWTWSPRFRRMMYLLIGTEPRAGVRKHSANLMGDVALGYRAQLNGCISLGERLGWLDGQKALLLSAPAMRRFESHMGHAPFLLEIRNG